MASSASYTLGRRATPIRLPDSRGTPTNPSIQPNDSVPPFLRVHPLLRSLRLLLLRLLPPRTIQDRCSQLNRRIHRLLPALRTLWIPTRFSSSSSCSWSSVAAGSSTGADSAASEDRASAWRRRWSGRAAAAPAPPASSAARSCTARSPARRASAPSSIALRRHLLHRCHEARAIPHG